MSIIVDFEQQLSVKELRDRIDRQDTEERMAMIAKLNERHAIVTISGATCVMNIDRDIATGHPVHTFSSAAQFCLRYQDRTIPDGRGGVITLAGAWLKSPHRRTYEGVTFVPGGAPEIEGHYNFWRGYTVNPVAGDNDALREMLNLIWTVHCAEDQGAYDYVLDWLADLFQHPTDRPGVALVFRGNRGTGKTFLAEMIQELLGPHFVKASQPRHVTGHFNEHLEKAQMLFMEEAVWAGDRQAESVMKDLITGRTLLIERKRMPIYFSPNYVRVIACSNEEFVAPAGPEERRYAVFDVADTRKQDAVYFAKLRHGMTQEGGLQAFLHFLLTREIRQDLRRMPKTRALADQKLYHLDHFDRWLFDMLCFGELTVAQANENGITVRQMEPWHASVASSSFYDDYCRSLKDMNSRALALSCAHFSRRLRARLEGFGKIRRTQVRFGDARMWMTTLPPLDACRKSFEAYLGQRIEWPEQ